MCSSIITISIGDFLNRISLNQEEAVAKRNEENADAYRQKVDLEEHMFHRLIETDQTQNQKIHKVNMVNLVSL